MTQAQASIIRFVAGVGIAMIILTGRTAASPQINLAGACSRGPYETVKDWISLFNDSYPEAHLTLSNVSSGAVKSALWGGIDCAINPVLDLCKDLGKDEFGTTDWGIGPIPFTASDYGNHASLQLQQLPALGRPVIPVYSKDVTGNLGLMSDLALNMTFDVIAGIFNGSIAAWNDPIIAAVNPGFNLPNEKITVFVRKDRSGMSEEFTETIRDAVPEWPDDATGNLPVWPLTNISDMSDISSPDIHHFRADGQIGIGHGLLRRPYSIGYLDLTHLSALNQFVSQAHVSNDAHSSANFVSADAVAIQNTIDGFGEMTDPMRDGSNMFQKETHKDGYPITQYLNWYIKRNYTEYEDCYQAWLLCTFIQWTYTDPRAVEIALEHGWVVPSQTVVKDVLTKLKEVQCIDMETTDRWGRPQVISALDYTPIPRRHNMRQINKIRVVGWNMAIVCILTSLLFSTWVLWKVNDRIVRASQPTFLYMICFGAFLMGCSIFPLGIDDSFLLSTVGCDVACMLFPWTITCGFSIAFSALFSKIWRINKLFHGPRFRRVKIDVTDVLKPFYVMFTLNIAFLTAWTVVDPFKWKRIHIDSMNSYGTCQGDGKASVVFIVLLLIVNGCALVLANVQAVKARHISDEFSESKYVGLAMASMLQMFTVGLPLTFLVKKNPSARFFVYSCIIFVVTMSLLLFIFLPKLCYRGSRGRRESNRQSYPNERMSISDNYSTNIAIRTAYNSSGRQHQNRDDTLKLKDYEKRVSLLKVKLDQQGIDCESLFDEVGIRPGANPAVPQRDNTTILISNHATVRFSLPNKNSLSLTVPNNDASSPEEKVQEVNFAASVDRSTRESSTTIYSVKNNSSW